MDKVAFGIAVYGNQPPEWWQPLAANLAQLYRYDIACAGILTARSMATDSNRNLIVKSFMKTGADWLMWVDADNNLPLGGIRRLLDTRKELVCGLYYLKAEPYTPVAYLQLSNRRYTPIKDWNRGELLPIDMAGMGATLVHRSVFEEIEKQFIPVQRWNGGVFSVHKDDVQGDIPEKQTVERPQITDGRYSESICKPDHELTAFPHFHLEYGRTEDLIFFENARRAGFQPYCDTSVEVEHIKASQMISGATYRGTLKTITENERREPSDLMIEALETEGGNHA